MNTICSKCGAQMTQTGAENDKARYHCSFCGSNVILDLSAENNVEYWERRTALMSRVRQGILEWETTPWDYLSRDIIDFTSRYEDASNDVYFKIAIIACITSGFRDMNEEKYKQCNQIFKLTERTYKRYQKNTLTASKRSFPHAEDVDKYREYRTMYKRCRNEYRNTKLLWKACFAVGKKLLFMKPF